MTLIPLFNADLTVQIHAFSAMLALALGPFILFRRKGDTAHKILGRVWVVAMIVTIGSSYFIHQIRWIGPFSPIHLLTVYGTFGLAQGIYFARKGNVPAHRSAMRGLYIGGLLVAGTLTLMPGRVLNRALFGEHGDSGFYLLLGGIAILIGLLLLERRLGIFPLRGLRRGSVEKVQ